MQKILIFDSTLRDGSHAMHHHFNSEQISIYTKYIEKSGMPIVEVGHGNGLGASSLQLGESLLSDKKMLSIARENLINSKLGCLIIPGFGTINKDLSKAIDIGVDVVRVASHCTEADITETHIKYARNKGKDVYGVLMMSHMVSKDVLAEEAHKMEMYGAHGVILMDSAGAYLPNDIASKVSYLVERLEIPVGFHAHNNLGLAVANSMAAVEYGATIIDGTIRGMGAGAGNAQLEVIVAILEKMGYETGVDLYKLLDVSVIAEKEIIKKECGVSPESIISGIAGVFSGFLPHVKRISEDYGIDARDVFFEIGKRQIIAGQEDLIIEVAQWLKGKK